MAKQWCAALAGLALAGSICAAPVQWSDNGHYYEFVAGPVDWDTAFAQANAATFNGMQGYLATITSAEENRFVAVTVGGGQLGWLGGSDEGNEGNWTWRNGPENGQAFTYTAWNSSEPNNCCGGENFLQINFASTTGGWNDHGGPGNPGQLNGFYIEYPASIGTVPEPASLALVGCGLLGLAARRRQQR